MAVHARFSFPVLWMAVDAGHIVFAVVYGQSLVNGIVADSAHFFCDSIFKNRIFYGHMRVVMATQAGASIPLRAFLMRRMAFGALGKFI